MESVQDRLKRVRETLAPEEWRDARIYRHNDGEFEHFTLVATKLSSGKVYYFDQDTGEFKPLNISGRPEPA